MPTKAAKKAAKKAGAPQKKPEDYLVAGASNAVSLQTYLQSPGSAFLFQLVEAKNTLDYCLRLFPKVKNSKKLTDEATDNLRQVTGPLFSSIMGHFETFQKCLFAGTLEVTRLLQNWDAEVGLKCLGDKLNPSPSRMLAYRGLGAQVGIVFADALPGWHGPEGVNRYFKAFDNTVDIFSSDEKANLDVLWQLRHTLVHTGGWLTLPDAQKVVRLRGHGDQSVRFDENFMLWLTRLFHRLVRDSVGRLDGKLRPRLQPGLPAADQSTFNELMKCRSPAPSYFV
jgi:hypothetical protein